MGLADFLPVEAIRTSVAVSDWREAIRASGDALVAAGVTEDAYTDEMIATVDSLGPYIVIAPGIALAHSRPSPAVLRAGLSWVTLAQPINFGNEANDPVTLVVGLAAPDHDGHLTMMSELAGAISDEAVLADLLAATSPEDLRTRLQATAGGDSAADDAGAVASAEGEER